jgi:hypothetical protein
VQTDLFGDDRKRKCGDGGDGMGWDGRLGGGRGRSGRVRSRDVCVYIGLALWDKGWRNRGLDREKGGRRVGHGRKGVDM